MHRLTVFRNTLFIVLISAGLVSCDPWFAYSPFEANLDESYRGNTEKNLALINAADAGDSKPFKIVVLSDPHYHYAKLDDAIKQINESDEYAFAIVAGDLTENGLKQEFIYFHESMEKLKIPYLTVIGNHDYVSNGEIVYNQMFGGFNYSFVYNNVKFIMFDNVKVESEKTPEMDWLVKELRNEQGYDHVIPVSHIPPFDTQMLDYRDTYHELLVTHHIPVSFHGHRHHFSMEELYGGGVLYVTVSSPQRGAYTELTITPTSVNVKKIEF